MSTKREFDTIIGVGLKLYMAKEDPVMHLCIFIHSSLASDYLHFHRFVSARHLHRLMFLSRVFVSLRLISFLLFVLVFFLLLLSVAPIVCVLNGRRDVCESKHFQNKNIVRARNEEIQKSKHSHQSQIARC